MVKIPTLDIESVSIRILYGQNSHGPSAKPLFTELLAERTEGLFKVYIQNRFNNNIARNSYNEMYY